MAQIFYIPSGPTNLTDLFPTVQWNSVLDYYIEVVANNSVIATTPLVKMGCCCSDDDIIIHFRTYAGGVDQIPFQKPTISHETTSEEWKKSLQYPLTKQDTGWNRFNVNANDTYEAINTCYVESDAVWLQELFDASIAFIQWIGTEGQSDDFLPIKIIDGTFIKGSSDYSTPKTVIKFKLSNDFIIQRN